MFKTDNRESLLARLDKLFTDREFFMRANGQVKFLKISAKLQKRVAFIVGGALLLWLFVTLAMLANQALVARDKLALIEREAEVADSASRIEAYRGDIDKVAGDLDRRQDMLEGMVKEHFGETVPAATEGETETKISENSDKISSAIPEAAALAKLEARQLAFAHKLTLAAIERTKKAEDAIRKFGLNPDQLASNTQSAMGGPFIPFLSDGETLPPTLERLNAALARMDQLERTLLAIPSAMPAHVGMLSSSYGYRRDPITGAGAMHSGMDFKGPHGTPIMAAAKGTVTHAGWKSGYGKTVEITHGNGLMTRYAHLSRIAVTAGQAVEQGLRVGAMGSTGRSTGTHLHFEVRMNGRAMNPRPFLEANSDVLEVKAIARQRTGTPGTKRGSERG